MSDETHAIASTFDRRAANYSKGEWHKRYAERLVELAALAPGQRVLDAGAGTGFAAIAIARRVGRSGSVVGIDVSQGMLHEARAAIDAAGFTNVQLLQADATALHQFSSSSFDAVICAAALLYMPVAAALREWRRVLAANGVVAFSTMRAGSPAAGQLFRECAAAYAVTLHDPSAALGSEDRCRAALESAGFAEVAVVSEHIDFSTQDLERAWDSNSRSPSHAAVRELDERDLETLRVRYEKALGARLAADAWFARSEVLYAFGRK